MWWLRAGLRNTLPVWHKHVNSIELNKARLFQYCYLNKKRHRLANGSNHDLLFFFFFFSFVFFFFLFLFFKHSLNLQRVFKRGCEYELPLWPISTDTWMMWSLGLAACFQTCPLSSSGPTGHQLCFWWVSVINLFCHLSNMILPLVMCTFFKPQAVKMSKFC